jgi:nicotinate-nucleotide adenylyltransferase
MEKSQRVAIYGGTFDPVHLGHLRIAREITQLFAIDQFLFVPARVAPHKRSRKVLPAVHRYAMLALATNDDPQLRISRFEIDAPDSTYTVDSLLHFRDRFGESSALFFILGADSWSEITTWRDWQRLVTLAHLIVITRPGYEIATDHVDAEIAERIVDLREKSESDAAKLIATGGHKIFVSDAVMLDVSATQVREAAQYDTDELSKLVPPAVAEYIRKYQLYRNTHEA